MRDHDNDFEPGRFDDGILTLTELRARRARVEVAATRMRRIVDAHEAGRAVAPDDAEWFRDGYLRYVRTGEPLCRCLGLRAPRGSHASAHALLRVVEDDEPHRDEDKGGGDQE